MTSRTPLALAAACALGLLTNGAQATNGTLLEGYGPIAAGMGGASTAYDNGNAAAANNPATLGLLEGAARLDVAVGLLGPSVSSRAGAQSADSGGTSYVMPAIGYSRNHGDLTYGLALFAQGGMGTEYGADSFLAMGSGAPVRSELGVGRLMLPLAWRASPELTLGASLDYVWSWLDMRMAAPGSALAGMVTGTTGNIAAALPSLGGAPWARVDFSDGSHYSGAASSSGLALKLGAVYLARPDLRVGASLHTRTSLGDMKTSASGASLSASGFSDTGRMTVQDFQMPTEFSLGAAWQTHPDLLLVADLQYIGWASVMKDLRLRYESAGMGGSVNFVLKQDWKDQTVLHVGAARRINSEWTLRAGLNLASNPIPDGEVNPLFPAIVANHITAGAAYVCNPSGELNASLSYAPEVKATSSSGVVVSHSQLNLQLMYSQRF